MSETNTVEAFQLGENTGARRLKFTPRQGGKAGVE